MKQICINCAPLTGNITGIERCIYENIKRIDKLAERDRADIVLLYPENTIPNFPNLDYLKTVPLQAKGNKIKISAMRKYIRDNNAVYFSIHGGLCFSKESVICTNDIRTWLHKEYDSFFFRLKCNINVLSSKFLASQMVTISETARAEISKNLHIASDKIEIIYPAWEHVLDIIPDNRIWDKIPGIKKKTYYYSLSSRAPHKNFRWIVEMAKRNPNDIFLIGGKKWSNSDYEDDRPQNLLYLGYVTDEENIELMKNCKAFLHPSKYEGFGMTPLEALACGAEVCVSNVSCLPEVFEDCVHYFDPDDYGIDLEILLSKNVTKPDKLLKKYSWNKSAKQWYKLMRLKS